MSKFDDVKCNYYVFPGSSVAHCHLHTGGTVLLSDLIVPQDCSVARARKGKDPA